MPETLLAKNAEASAVPEGGFGGKLPQKEGGPDIFADGWQKASEYYKKRYHPIYNAGYLAYKSIQAANFMYGADYLKAFGYTVFDPLTFQSVEGIKAQLNARKVEYAAKSQKKKGEDKEKYIARLDNIEWQRSGCPEVRSEVVWYALVTGVGYYGNFFCEDRVMRHFPVTKAEKESKPQDPEDGEPQEDTMTPVKKLKWEEKEVVKYQGMKPTAESPWFIFPNPGATSRKDWNHVYRYKIWTVAALREFVVSKGWMTKEESLEKIVASKVTRFDAIRETIDAIYQQKLLEWSRGDHTSGPTQAPSDSPDTNKDVDACATIERYEENYYEIRLDGITETLYKDFNVYPHKEIPIVPAFCDKIPGEMSGIGIPEMSRHQQISANRIQNYTLNALLMAIVQRYAINSALVENDTDLSFSNPFRPIRLKRSLPGITVQQAVMPLPQPDIKDSPFKMMQLVKQSLQNTTGATDFVVASSNATTETATESNNLLAASTSRVREYARSIDEESLTVLVNQWHPCYGTLYDQELEFRLTGEKVFTRFIPQNKAEVDEDKKMIEKAEKELNVAPGAAKTLTDVYKTAGYDMVIYLDDLTGNFETEAILTDVRQDSERAINAWLRIMKIMNETNAANAASGDPRKFDVFEAAKEAVKQFPESKDFERFLQNVEKPAIPQVEQPMPEDPNMGIPFPTSVPGGTVRPPVGAGVAPAGPASGKGII